MQKDLAGTLGMQINKRFDLRDTQPGAAASGTCDQMFDLRSITSCPQVPALNMRSLGMFLLRMCTPRISSNYQPFLCFAMEVAFASI